MPLELEAAARVALPPKRDNSALDTAPAEPGSTARASVTDTKVPMFRGDSVGRTDGEVGRRRFPTYGDALRARGRRH